MKCDIKNKNETVREIDKYDNNKKKKKKKNNKNKNKKKDKKRVK